MLAQWPARHPALSTCIMGAQSADEVDGFISNFKVGVESPSRRGAGPDGMRMLAVLPLHVHVSVLHM